MAATIRAAMRSPVRMYAPVSDGATWGAIRETAVTGVPYWGSPPSSRGYGGEPAVQTSRFSVLSNRPAGGSMVLPRVTRHSPSPPAAMSFLRPVLATAAALAILASVATAAPRLFADIAGRWDVTVSSPGGSQPATMTVAQKDDAITGTFESSFGTAELTGTAKGDSVKFSMQLDVNGQVLAINGTAAVKDQNNMSGVLDVSGMGAMPFTAVRQP